MATQADLDEARISYHKLMTGQATRVYVDQNGERVEYAVANAARLLAYIQELEQRVSGVKILAPMRPYF